MIKKSIKIFFFTLLFIFSSNYLFSQGLDTNTRVTIYSEQISVDTIDFEFRALRLTDNFLTNWANSTFMLRFDDEDFDYGNLEVIQHPDQSDIPYHNQTDPSFNAYINQIQVVDKRIAIGFRGPYSFDSTMFVPSNQQDYVVLGRFRAYTIDGSSFPRGQSEDGLRLLWLRPVNYFQDFAYKTDREIDSVSVEGWFLPDDNVSAINNYTTVNFVDDGSDRPEMILEFFKARYAGDLKVILDWKTISEAFNRGFIIRRGRMPFNSNDPEDVTYDTEVANHNNPEDEPFLKGLGTSNIGKSYRYQYDTVETRSITYCYELLYEDTNGDIFSLAKSCLTVPNAVLTYLQANPNPATDEALVEYTVDDDVYLTANLYEVTGKKVMNFYQDEFVPMGTHNFTINIPSTLASGMYEIVLEAIPINDTSVEKSRGVFKLQVIR